MHKLDQYIAGIYHSAATSQTNIFREKALRALHDLIPFDAALWATGSFERRKFHTTTLLELPIDFAENLMSSQSINPITDELYKHPGVAVDMSDAISDKEFYQSELYRNCFRPYGIERILSSGHMQERSGIFTILTLYRGDRVATFTQSEKEIQNRAIYHLLNAASQSYFLHLKEQHILKPEHSAAICDKHGFIYEAESTFIELLDLAFPERSANKICFPIILDKMQTMEKISCRTSALGDLFCIEIWPLHALDALTVRERQVVDGVGKGLTFKEVARQLELSPSTISNHLYRVYGKLDINSRCELAALLDSG